ncbi:DinB family protein [Vibrio spartinae]|uniref:DinB family protein n=1 Tax=Vibrio spartinae TaxID=1918945 RepID=A0ABX6QZN5_9VIBR|nr:DinB family protein [Vibrio spartinae]QMV14684.1 hypothetical protein Vspart_01945 [Vibrio spartinae]
MFAMLNTLNKTEQDGTNLPVIKGGFEALAQGHQFLEHLSDEQYTYVALPHVASSVGQHYRHWLDIFHAIKSANKVIDYNQRRRGHGVESSRQMAMSEISELVTWLSAKTELELKRRVSVVTEVCVTQTEACTMTSTLERELTFASLHANHHFAMAKVVCSLLGVETDAAFGLAPATMTYIRGQ